MAGKVGKPKGYTSYTSPPRHFHWKTDGERYDFIESIAKEYNLPKSKLLNIIVDEFKEKYYGKNKKNT